MQIGPLKIPNIFAAKKQYKQTRWANCVVAPEEKSDKLVINEGALDSIHKHFRRIVSLVGRPGVGKSTLASSVYNQMRGDKHEYFKISASQESFTKGIWSLKENVKVSKLAYDDRYGIDILDLEGLANSNSIHYLVVIALALSDGIVLCNLGKRFNFDALETIIAGIRIYKQKKINLPKPTIFLQIKHGKKKFKLNDGSKVDRTGFISYIKKKYVELQDFNIQLFGVYFVKGDDDYDSDDSDYEDNKPDPRLDSKYTQSVKEFIKQLQTIPKSRAASEDRVKYAITMVKALNNNSPDMIVQLNFKFFTAEARQIGTEEEKEAIKQLKLDANLKGSSLSKMVKYNEFCELVVNGGKYYYGQRIAMQLKQLSYYDPNAAQYTQFIQQYNDRNKYFICVDKYCRAAFDAAIAKVKQKLLHKGQKVKEKKELLFEAFISEQVNTAINKIRFMGHTGMPYDVSSRVQQKRRQIGEEIEQKSEGVIKLENNDFSMDVLNTEWATKVSDLKSDWEKRKTKALGVNKRKVTTSGDHRCPKCSNDHTPGVGHKKCGQGALWYWVDAQTYYCICDRCKELSTITGVCCWSCSTTLNAKVVPIN